MRVLAMLTLVLSLGGCNGDRMKDSNLPLPNAPAGHEMIAQWRPTVGVAGSTIQSLYPAAQSRSG
jgi:hypothetical protein